MNQSHQKLEKIKKSFYEEGFVVVKDIFDRRKINSILKEIPKIKKNQSRSKIPTYTTQKIKK